jgi:hypothetical protein
MPKASRGRNDKCAQFANQALTKSKEVQLQMMAKCMSQDCAQVPVSSDLVFNKSRCGSSDAASVSCSLSCMFSPAVVCGRRCMSAIVFAKALVRSAFSGADLHTHVVHARNRCDCDDGCEVREARWHTKFYAPLSDDSQCMMTVDGIGGLQVRDSWTGLLLHQPWPSVLQLQSQ